jgi:Putative DNA-binding domain
MSQIHRFEPLPLDQIQRWLQAVIMHPDGVEAGIESDEARAEIDVPPGGVEQVVDPSQRRTSIERIEVYANAYYARLLECLRDEFPALFHALGEEIFDGLAFGYLQAYPSTSYTLTNLGRHFVQFLEETRPIDEGEEGPSWPDFMIDLARLERTYGEIFDGPGSERLKLLEAEEIQRIQSDEWPSARLMPVPCLRLLCLRYPVQEYATGVRKKEDPPLPDPQPTWLAVSRINYVVRRWTLSQIQYDLLAALIAGQAVGEAIENAALAARTCGESLDGLADNLRSWFQEWSCAGFFKTIEKGAK